MGQLILETGEIIKQDIFSHTVAGKPWTAHEWLSEVIMAAVYNSVGFAGLSILSYTLVGFTILLLFKASQSVSDEWSAFLAISIAAAMAQTHLLVRPHLLTWFLGAYFLLILMQQNRWLWSLPLLTALWSNLHGGVLLGLVMQGAFLLGNLFDSLNDRPLSYWQYHWQQHKTQALVFILSLLAIGCNPFGHSLLLFPFHVSAEVFSQHILEWQAPDLREMWYVRYWLVFIGVLVAVYARKSSWPWRLLLLFLVYQAMGHIRHVSIAAMFLAPWTAMAIYDLKKTFRRSKKVGHNEVRLSAASGPVLLSVSFLLLFGISFAQPQWWQSFTKSRFTLPQNYSKGAISFLQDHGFPGKRLLNEYSWGGFLIFTFDPPPKVFIDGRADMYGEEVFGDFAKIHYLHPEIDDLLKKHRIDWVLYPTRSSLAHYLQKAPSWVSIYEDEHVTIFDQTESMQKVLPIDKNSLTPTNN